MYIGHLHFLICELLAHVLFCEFFFILYFTIFKKKEMNILYSLSNLVIYSLSTIVSEESIYSIQKKGKFKYMYFVMNLWDFFTYFWFEPFVGYTCRKYHLPLFDLLVHAINATANR